jgi:hypothetical protein
VSCEQSAVNGDQKVSTEETQRGRTRNQNSIHHRDTEYAEIEEFTDQELFTLRSPRLRGAISEACFTGKAEAFFRRACR